MKTKIVYVLVSSDKDIYLEQAYVSMYSLKMYNPDSVISALMDVDTLSSIQNNEVRRRLSTYIDEFISVEFESSVTPKERSRHLKTSMREYIEGTFLFLDTDTVICSQITEIDTWNFDLGIVLDLHTSLVAHPYGEGIKSNIRRMYNIDIPSGINYYNSGVMFVKDNDKTRDFFKRWHENWKSTKDLPGGLFDQQSLIKTEIDFNGFIHPLTGDYNCQILGSIQYLYTAKIIHFFNTQWNGEKLSPLFEKSFYRRFKQTGLMDNDALAIIKNCKSSFISPSMPIGKNDMIIWSSPAFEMLRKLKKHSLIEAIYMKCIVRSLNFILKRM